MSESTKRILSKSFLIVILISTFVSLVMISYNKATKNTHNNIYERLVEDVVEVKIGEPVKFANINSHFKSFAENSKSKKYIYSFQKAYTVGALFDSGSSNYHSDVYVDKNGNVIANKTGVYKLEYSLSSYDISSFSNSNTSVLDQNVRTFSNIIAVYENDYSNYAPFPYSDTQLFSSDISVKNYIITKDLALTQAQANQLIWQNSNFGCIINPDGYTITIDTSLGLSGFLRQNNGILDGLKINYVSSHKSALRTDFYGLANHNTGYITNCEVTGSVYLDNDYYNNTACLPMTGFVYNNLVNLKISCDNDIFAFDEKAAAEDVSPSKTLWKIKDNSVKLDAWYFTDKVNAARKVVKFREFNGNIIQHRIFDSINYSEKYDVVLKIPLSINSDGETIYNRQTLNFYKNSPLEISKDLWAYIIFGITPYEQSAPKVLHWLVDGVIHENLNEVLVTKNTVIEPNVKYTKSYKSVDPNQGIVHKIFNADEDVVNISHYTDKNTDETLINSTTISSLFDNPRAVLPSKIIMNKDCVVSQSLFFWENNLPYIQRYMENGGKFVIENGNSHFTMIQNSSLCSADGKTLIHYFAANGQEEISLHHQINSVDKGAFWNSQNIKKLDLTYVSTIDYNGLSNLQSLEEIKLGYNINIINNLNNRFFLLQLDSLKIVEIDSANAQYKAVDNFVTEKNFDSLLFTPNSLEGTVTIPEGVKHLEKDALNGCKAQKIILPSTLKGFKESAFNNMYNLEEIVFGDSDSISGLSDSTANLLSNLKRMSFSDVTTNIEFTIELFANVVFEKIVLPANLTSFYMNNNTTEFEISEDNLIYSTIDGVVYKKDIYNTIKTLYLYPAHKAAESFEVSEGIENIDFIAFQNTNLKTVILPTTLKKIYGKAFTHSNIEKVEIKSTNVTFYQDSFYGCQSLSEVELPENATTSIFDNAFNGCKSLKSFDYMSVVHLGSYAFANSAIESFEITDNVTHFGENVFAFSNIVYFKASSNLNGLPAFTFMNSKIATVDLGGVTLIGGYAFHSCTELKQIDLKNVTYISDNAFRLSALTEIESQNVISIGKESFSNCENLKTVSFANLTELKSQAFLDSAVETVYLPNLAIISEKAFYNCQYLTSLTLASKIQLKDSVFTGTKLLNDLNSTITKLTEHSLNASYFEEINLEIGNDTFDYSIIKDCNNLKTINIKQIGLNELSFSYKTFENIKHSVDIYLDVYYFSWGGIISSNLNIYVPSNLFDEYYDVWLHSQNILAYDFTIGEVTNKLSLIRGLNIGGNVTGGGQYTAGEIVTVVATTNTGFIFQGWYSGNELISQSEEFSFAMPQTALTLKAVWNERQYLSYFNFTLLDDGTYGVSKAQDVDLPLELNLPKEYNGKAVTAIYSPSGVEGTFAFTSIIKVFIPNSYTSIDDSAFSNCAALESVIFEENSRLKNINSFTFSSCESLETITIPQSVESIHHAAFLHCTTLESVIFEEGSKLTGIRDSAFTYCYSLKNIQIPSKVESIGYEVFSHCTALESVTFSQTDILKSISNNTFYNCSKLDNIELPKSLISVGSSAFYGTKIYNNTQDNSIVYVSDWAVGFKGNIQGAMLKDTTVGIASSAFSNCNSLANIFIPNSVKYINTYAFSYCISLESVIFEQDSSLLVIMSYAFRNCSSLETIEIPNTVTTISVYAFQSCDSLQAINVASGSQNHMSENGVLFNYYKTHLMSYPGGKVGFYTVPEGVEFIWDGAFYENSNLTGITFPESLKIIGTFAFVNCHSLTEINLPASVYSISDRAFAACSSLQNINVAMGNTAFSDVDGVLYNKDKTVLIQMPAGRVVEYVVPENTVSIGNSAFTGCDGLTNITIAESVTNIGAGAFSNCENLLEVYIPSSVNYIGTQAFWHCEKLTTVILHAQTPPELGMFVFNGTPSSLKIYVPENSLNLYKSKQAWKDYSNNIQSIQGG